MRQEQQPKSNHEGNLRERLARGEFIGPFPPFSLPRGIGEERDALGETRLALRRQDRRDNRGEQPSRKQSYLKPDGFEPFLNREPQERSLFENNYGGNFSQKMELNRKGVERVLKIAHLDGKVVLSSLSQSRSRSEVQGNELAAKRVVSTPEGWRIEINDARIIEELSEQQRLTGDELQRAFVRMFNSQLRGGLMECVWREKCSSEKDEYFRKKLFPSVLFPTSQIMLSVLFRENPLLAVIIDSATIFTMYGLLNLHRRLGFSAAVRNLDHPLEYFMPPVEIDKVGRAFAYLAMKGRTLVREATP